MNRVVDIRNSAACTGKKRGDRTEPANPATAKKPVGKSTRKPLPKRKSSRQAPAKLPKKTRADLSFTALQPSPEGKHPDFINWCPPVIPMQQDQWNKGRDLGLSLMTEIAALALDDEEHAFNAMRFAFNEHTWRTGGHGVESGFAEGVAALAVVGLRYMARGAAPFDSEASEKDDIWTARELINVQLNEVAGAAPELLRLRETRALATIAAFLNVGLIDVDTFRTANRQVSDLVEKRAALQKPAKE